MPYLVLHCTVLYCIVGNLYGTVLCYLPFRYSPNIKEMKVVDKRRARRAKLYYLRDKIARMSTVN